jgi:hypothetical protein
MISGGTAPYNFHWEDGGGTVWGFDTALAGLPAGTYWLYIGDANGCSFEEMITIDEPDALSISVGSTDETSVLNDGSGNVIASGGNPPYAYSWTSLGSSLQTASNLSPGVYTVVVIDANGCTVSGSASVNAYVPTDVINIKNANKTLIKITDVLGKETPSTSNTALFYIYDDGTVHKIIVIE